ncbi:hypothetical protein BKA63DRAFT_607075 [Paraphoma chrysanthemicola]|nr:hypothetical protein BKA63DRAFT_607075 [Paraphoma chrysanthemicola]
MPPKRRARAEPAGPAPMYTNATGYYKGAYRAPALNRFERDGLTIIGTLAWLWRYASAAEKQTFTDAYTNAVQALPATDDNTIPSNPKIKDDPAPNAAPGPGPCPAVAPVPAATRINTTSMPLWPDIATINAELPAVTEGDLNDRDKSSEEKRKWLEAGLHDPTREQEAKRWHGAHFLGHGAQGRAGLWVRVDETMNIDETIAARDVATMQPPKWTNPVSWRDHLPREIAILVRLNEQNGHEHNIHRYLGHRISFWQRRYRVFNEACELGDLYRALTSYSKPWLKRRNMFRWLETHPEISEAKERYEAEMEDSQDIDDGETERLGLQDAIEEAWDEYEKERTRRQNDEADGITREPAGSEIYKQRTHADFDDVPDIDKWNGKPLPEGFPEVIDEAFIWHVFDSLANALLVLKNGSGVDIDGKEWKEIIHRDLYTSNIFVKPPKDSEGKVLNPTSSNADCLIEYTQDDFPQVVLADWDQAFFDLQSGDDAYADNPFHYAIDESANNIPENGGRYPPELYWDYAGHTPAVSKLTSKTDVWALGQIIWNLIMQNTFHQSPFFDCSASSGTLLVNGTPYANPTAENLLSGAPPFEAAARYTDGLKDLVRECLRYGMQDRPDIEEIKRRTAEGVERCSGQSEKGRVRIGVSWDLRDFRIGEKWPAKRKGREDVGEGEGEGSSG